MAEIMTDKEFETLKRKLDRVSTKLKKLQEQYINQTGRRWVPEIIVKRKVTWIQQ